MSGVILIRLLDKRFSADEQTAGNRSDCRAHPRFSRDGFISRSRWNDAGTCKLAPREFVDHERFESECDWIDVVHPPTPARHIVNGDGEAGEHDDAEDKNASGRERLFEGPRESGHRAKDVGHDQADEEVEEDKEEVRAWCERR